MSTTLYCLICEGITSRFNSRIALSRHIKTVHQTHPTITEAPAPAPLKQGDWILYQGKPRQVYEYFDNSFAAGGSGCLDMIITVDLKNPIKASEVTRLIEVKHQ